MTTTITGASVESATRSGSGGSESRSATLQFDAPNPSPPPTTVLDAITFVDLSEGYYDDFVAAMAGGLDVAVTYDETTDPDTIIGVTLSKP